MPSPKRPQSRQPPWQDEEAGPSDFGPWLKRQRELRGVGLRDIADDTKISLRYLQALEANRFDVLPAQVFVRGFLRQYSHFVGLDADEVVNAFLTAAQEESPENEGMGISEEGSGASRVLAGRGWMLILIAASVAAVMVLAALAAFSWRQSREEPSPPPATHQSAPESQAKPVPGTAGTSSALSVPLAPSAPSAPSSSVHQAAGEEQAPGGAPTSGPTREEDAALGSQSAEPASAAPIVVILDFSADCWVDATSDGSRRVSKLAVQGESVRIEAQRQVSLTLGDGDAVHIQVNGHPFTLPLSRHKVRHLVIDLSSVSALTAGSPGAHE